MRIRRFPLGYIVLPCLVVFSLLLLRSGFMALAASADQNSKDPMAATVIEKDVDPRFLDLDRPVDPQARLEAASDHRVPDGRGGDADFDEFVEAMADHPYVEQVFLARYSKRLKAASSFYGASTGLTVFRDHYKRAVAVCYPRSYLPMTGPMLSASKQRTMEMLLLDRTWARQVDRDVLAAINAH